MMVANEMSEIVEETARAHYENARNRVAGRPPWHKLDPNCPYDMGMRAHAITEARKILRETKD